MQLTIQNVSKTYPGGVRALKDVSLDIGPGMFGLMGPNGAGKSTLMRIVATLQAADAGAVSFDETDTLKDKAGIRKRLGYLPQDFGLYPDVSAERMLDHIAFLKGIIERKERRASVQAMLERTNLADDKKRKLGTFSGGMIQRFGIAQALIADPDLLVVDEPTAGLDPEERNRFLNVLSETSENKIVVLSTHIVDDVRVLCPRMAVIHEGRILFSGDTTDALGALRNKLWRKTIGKDELARYDEAYEVVLTRMVSGRMEIHVAGGRPPEEGFEPIEPDLEDAYFRIVKGSRNESGR
jgi:ABC-2 type transport system ATP-binding protein